MLNMSPSKILKLFLEKFTHWVPKNIPQTDETKWCVDCVHYVLSTSDYVSNHRCVRVDRRNPITGIDLGIACSIERTEKLRCGPDGSGFEPQKKTNR